MINVLIADDHAIVRTGLRALLRSEPGLQLVGEATSGYEAIELVGKTHPDILILDLSMPDLDGIAVTRQLKPQYPDLRILILTVHEDEAMLREAIKAGASGYIVKRAAEAELIAAIETIRRGDPYVDPALLRVLLGESTKPRTEQAASPDPLTPRETDVLKLIVQGYTNRQVGEELSISVRTVEGDRANLLERRGLRTRVELVRYARDRCLIG